MKKKNLTTRNITMTDANGIKIHMVDYEFDHQHTSPQLPIKTTPLITI
jgi:hypothetical protein